MKAESIIEKYLTNRKTAATQKEIVKGTKLNKHTVRRVMSQMVVFWNWKMVKGTKIKVYGMKSKQVFG